MSYKPYMAAGHVVITKHDGDGNVVSTYTVSSTWVPAPEDQRRSYAKDSSVSEMREKLYPKRKPAETHLGPTCKRNHVPPLRYVATGRCVECERLRHAKRGKVSDDGK